LKPELHLSNVKVLFQTYKEHEVTVTVTNRLMLFGEIIDVYF